MKREGWSKGVSVFRVPCSVRRFRDFINGFGSFFLLVELSHGEGRVVKGNNCGQRKPEDFFV